MSTNPLKTKGSSGSARSVFRALEWAQMARDKGLDRLADMWTKAAAERWDDDNYCPLAAEEYRTKIREAQAKWA